MGSSKLSHRAPGLEVARVDPGDGSGWRLHAWAEGRGGRRNAHAHPRTDAEGDLAGPQTERRREPRHPRGPGEEARWTDARGGAPGGARGAGPHRRGARVPPDRGRRRRRGAAARAGALRPGYAHVRPLSARGRLPPRGDGAAIPRARTPPGRRTRPLRVLVPCARPGPHARDLQRLQGGRRAGRRRLPDLRRGQQRVRARRPAPRHARGPHARQGRPRARRRVCARARFHGRRRTHVPPPRAPAPPRSRAPALPRPCADGARRAARGAALWWAPRRRSARRRRCSRPRARHSPRCARCARARAARA